jgi:hypothetical protein
MELCEVRDLLQGIDIKGVIRETVPPVCLSRFSSRHLELFYFLLWPLQQCDIDEQFFRGVAVRRVGMSRGPECWFNDDECNPHRRLERGS